MQLGGKEIILKGAKSDTTRKPNTTNSYINRLKVEAKGVQIIFRPIRLTHLINKSCSCSTCEPYLTYLTHLANKDISFCYYYYLIFCCNYMFLSIFMVVIVF